MDLIHSSYWETDLSLLQIYLQLPTNAPGQKVALQFLQNISNTIDNFNAIWGTKIKSWGDIEQLPINTFNSKNPISINQTGLFAQLVMERYGQLTYPIIKSYDPNHLVFGLRFADLPSDWILTGLKNYCDVFSPSGYYWTPRLERMDQIFTKFDKPILIHEFSWKAMDAWVFNAFYTGAIVYTQSQRGLGFEDYIKNFMAKPYAVGYDFYRWGNAPMDFFIYGENWGMVDLHDNPYEKFVNMVTKTNLLVESYHFNSDVPIKGRFFRINVGIQSILAIISIGIVMKYKYSYENQILEKQRVMEGKIHAIQGGKMGIIVIKILKWIYTILLITLFFIPIITQWLLKGG